MRWRKDGAASVRQGSRTMNQIISSTPPAATRKPVPRGIARSGPAVLSEGFRPIFLLAGIVAVLDKVLWIGAQSGWWEVGGS